MKPPAFQFYVRDWLTDTELSACPPLVRGVWIDLLANMWVASNRGLLTGTVEQLSRMCRCSQEEMNETIDTIRVLKVARVTLCNGKVTVVNRRMRRDEVERKSNADRQKRYRHKHNAKGNVKSNGKITSYSASASASASANISFYRQFTDLWCLLWEEKYNVKYPWAKGKDGATAARLWEAVGQDLVKAKLLFSRYLENGDTFYQGHPLAMLGSASVLPKFLVKLSADTPGETAWDKLNQ